MGLMMDSMAASVILGLLEMVFIVARILTLMGIQTPPSIVLTFFATKITVLISPTLDKRMLMVMVLETTVMMIQITMESSMLQTIVQLLRTLIKQMEITMDLGMFVTIVQMMLIHCKRIMMGMVLEMFVTTVRLYLMLTRMIITITWSGMCVIKEMILTKMEFQTAQTTVPMWLTLTSLILMGMMKVMLVMMMMTMMVSQMQKITVLW